MSTIKRRVRLLQQLFKLPYVNTWRNEVTSGQRLHSESHLQSTGAAAVM